MPDYLTLVKEKIEEQQALDDRMQADSDLLYLKKFQMQDVQKKLIPDIINVTLNKPAVFAANVISALGGASQQTIVESDSKKIDTYEIEQFQEAAFTSANVRLQKQPGMPQLNAFADIQLCIRGRTAYRVLFRMEGDILVPDITPWDGRYTWWDAGVDGLLWAAYQTHRSRAKIESEYHIVIMGKVGRVLDVWDKQHNEVWVDEQKVFEQANPYGFPPVVIQVVSLGYGSSLLDGSGGVGGGSPPQDRTAREGESIFFLIRDIVPELNRLASILQTLNLKLAKPPVEQERPPGAETSEYEEVMGLGHITAKERGGGTTPIDYGDAKRAAQMLYGIMEQAMQQGSLSSIDLGSLQFPLSAVALVELGEGRDQVFLPRLQAKALLNQATAEMFTRQVIQLGGTVELGTPGHKRAFSTKKLEGEYETTYKYTTKSPKIDIARMTVANAAERYFDKETILKDILMVEDWEGVKQRRYYDMAEVIDPLILRHRIIMNMLKLAEDGDEDAAREAQIMAASMGMSLAQVKAGQLPKPPEPEKPAEPVIPLLGEGGQVGGIPSSGQKAAALQATPREAVQEE